MLYLLGTDEAGYGPNLGPLVVAATLWRVEDASLAAPPNLYELLAAVISSEDDGARIAIADSKQLYSSGDSLALLELGVLAGLHALDRPVSCWQRIWKLLCPQHCCELAWHAEFDSPLPCATSAETLLAACQRLTNALTAGPVRLVAMHAATIYPAEFNAHCDRLDSKGALLSSVTLSLVRELLRHSSDGPAYIVCDKHGGRNRYAALLWEELIGEAESSSGFPVQTIRESRAESLYRWRTGPHQREIRFISQGERFLPAALASMTAKYLRELAMQAFNAYWAQRVPNIKPTAGYPGDALRFWGEIEAAANDAKLDKRTLWRDR